MQKKVSMPLARAKPDSCLAYSTGSLIKFIDLSHFLLLFHTFDSFDLCTMVVKNANQAVVSRVMEVVADEKALI